MLGRSVALLGLNAAHAPQEALQLQALSYTLASSSGDQGQVTSLEAHPSSRSQFRATAGWLAGS